MTGSALTMAAPTTNKQGITGTVLLVVTPTLTAVLPVAAPPFACACKPFQFFPSRSSGPDNVRWELVAHPVLYHNDGHAGFVSATGTAQTPVMCTSMHTTIMHDGCEVAFVSMCVSVCTCTRCMHEHVYMWVLYRSSDTAAN